jgi:hypothetical protein
MLQVIRAAGVITAMAGVGVAGAASDDPQGQGSIRFSNPELSMSGSIGGCGQSCLYGKANDVLTLQTEYLSRLADRLVRERQSLSETKITQEGRARATDVLKRNLQNYCVAQRIGGSVRGWNDRCLGQYLHAVASAIETNRKALLENYRRVSDLSDGPGALPGREGLKSPRNTGRLLRSQSLLRDDRLTVYPDFPFHPSIEAIDPVVRRLGATARRQIRERSSIYSGKSSQEKAAADEELVKWWNSLPKCPSQDEYPKTEFVERYPSNPTGEKIPRIMTDSKTGKIVPDVSAYLAARELCEQKMKEAFREIPLELQAEGEPQTDGQPSSRMTEKYQAFDEARSAMVTAIDEKFKKSKEDKEYVVTLFGDGKNQRPGFAPVPGEDLSKRIRELRVFAASLMRTPMSDQASDSEN